MEFDLLVSNSFWVVPLVVAVVQSIKMLGIATKYAPILSIGIGIGLALLVNADFDLPQMLLSGIIYGLSASGLYSGVSVTQKVAEAKSGDLPLNKIDKRILSEQDIKEIEQKKSQNPDSNNS